MNPVMERVKKMRKVWVLLSDCSYPNKRSLLASPEYAETGASSGL